MDNEKISGYLVEDEEIIYAVKGFKKHYGHPIKLFITDRRVIFDFVSYELLRFRYWHIKDIDFRHLSSIESKTFRMPIFLILAILSFSATLIPSNIIEMSYDVFLGIIILGIAFSIVYIFYTITVIVFITAAESYNVNGLSEKSIQDIIKIIRKAHLGGDIHTIKK